MKKRKIVLTAAVLVLAFGLLFPRFWARHRALEYLEQKYNKYVVYGDVIRLEDIKFNKTWVNIFTGYYSVLMEYDGVAFGVYSGGDTYTEKYLEKFYVELLYSDGMEELVYVPTVNIIIRNLPSALALDKNTDVKFYMELRFRKSFGTKEEYAAAVRRVIDRLEEVGLTCCDRLGTAGYVNEKFTTCAVFPMGDNPAVEEIWGAVVVNSYGI